MRRVLLGAGLLLCGLLQDGAMLGSQEPAVMNGAAAVRFEQAPGFYHYAALCRTATEFTAQAPTGKLPRESTELAVCWYVMATKLRKTGAKIDESAFADGKLILSAHHVRFVPRDPRFADLYTDFHPEETELLHQPGQPFGAIGTTEILIDFRFSKLCPTCAPGAPIPEGSNSALLDQEFALIHDAIKHFDAGYRKIYVMSTHDGPDLRAQNQAAAATTAKRSPAPAAKPSPASAAKSSLAASANPASAPAPKPGAVPAAKPAAIPASKPNVIATATPGTVPTARSSAAAPAAQPGMVSTRASAAPAPQPSAVAAAKPAPVPAVKPGAAAVPVPGAPPAAKPSSQEQPAAVAVTNPEAATPGVAPALNPSPIKRIRPNPMMPALKPVPTTSVKQGPVAPVLTAAGSAPANPGSVSPEGTVAAAKGGVPPPVATAAPGAVAAETPLAPQAVTTQRQGSHALTIAPGTAEGMLVKKVPPAYPLQAKVERVQGTVILNATISRTGSVSTVDVVSGPPLLQSAAVDAVKQWLYRPFSFNGVPVEVETTIHVVFGAGAPPPRAAAQGQP